MNGRLPSGLAGRLEAEVAEHPGHRDEAEDRHDPPEGAAHEEQERERADRVGGHPLGGEGETEQDADDRHRDPERTAPAPPARPDGGEHGVGGDDEQADVDVVHADPRLDEEHPVEQDEGADERRHEPAPEQDPRQQVQAGGHQDAGDHAGQAPGEGVRADGDRGGLPVVPEHEELLAVLGDVRGGDVHRPGHRFHPGRQRSVGVDGVPVRLDDIDRPRIPGRTEGARRSTEDVDLLGGVVVRDPRARPGQRMSSLVGRATRRVVTPDGDDGIARVVGRTDRDVQLGVVDLGDEAEAVGPAVVVDRARHAGRARIDERDPVARGHRDARQVGDGDPGQATVGDGLVDLGPVVADAGCAQHDLLVRGGVGQARLVVGRVAADELDEDRGDGGRIVDVGRYRHEGGAGPGRRQVGDVGQVDRSEDRGRIDVHRGQRVARGGQDRGPVVGDEQVGHRMSDRGQRRSAPAPRHRPSRSR